MPLQEVLLYIPAPLFGLISFTASLAVYLEFSSYFPHRSGAEVAYLEKVTQSYLYF